MVARVDKALREELGMADGLADRERLRARSLLRDGRLCDGRPAEDRRDARWARGRRSERAEVKKAALSRVLGFEIMPAPFVVAHLQVGMQLQRLGVGA